MFLSTKLSVIRNGLYCGFCSQIYWSAELGSLYLKIKLKDQNFAASTESRGTKQGWGSTSRTVLTISNMPLNTCFILNLLSRKS